MPDAMDIKSVVSEKESCRLWLPRLECSFAEIAYPMRKMRSKLGSLLSTIRSARKPARRVDVVRSRGWLKNQRFLQLIAFSAFFSPAVAEAALGSLLKVKQIWSKTGSNLELESLLTTIAAETISKHAGGGMLTMGLSAGRDS